MYSFIIVWILFSFYLKIIFKWYNLICFWFDGSNMNVILMPLVPLLASLVVCLPGKLGCCAYPDYGKLCCCLPSCCLSLWLISNLTCWHLPLVIKNDPLHRHYMWAVTEVTVPPLTPESWGKCSSDTFGYKIIFWENILYVWDYSNTWEKLVESIFP